MFQLRGMPKWIGPIVIFSWGLQVKLLTGRYFIFAWICGFDCYVSKDGTPPDSPGAEGYFIFHRLFWRRFDRSR